MNRLLCWLTGGHKYADTGVVSAYDSHIGVFVRVRCGKCGKAHTMPVNTEEDIEAFEDWYAEHCEKNNREDGNNENYVR